MVNIVISRIGIS